MTPTASPKVRVCIPTFNRAPFLREAVASVLDQTFGDFVLEIVDNASTDDTAGVAGSFLDPRISYRRRQENVGLLENHRDCWAYRDTEFLLVLADDDRLHPDFLARCVAIFDSHPRIGLVHTAFDVVGPGGEFLEVGNWTYGLDTSTVESGSTFLRESMRWSCRVCPSAAMVRTAAIPSDPLDERDFPAIDFGLWLRIAKAGWDVAFVCDTLADYRVHVATHSAAQLGQPQSGGYVQSLETVEALRSVKRRFLAEHAGPVERERWSELVDRCVRWEIATAVKKTTLDSGALPLRRLRFLGRATRLEPRILLDGDVWRMLAADVAGPRGRRTVHRLRAWSRPATRTGAAGR